MTDKERLENIICEAIQINGCVHSCNHPPCAMVKCAVSNLLASGVTVREKGEWDIRIDDYDCEYMVCSACGTDFFDGANDTVDYKPNFCPVCGADMRGDT